MDRETDRELLCGRSEAEWTRFESDVRASGIKKVEGPKLFQWLEDYLANKVSDANRRAGKNEYQMVCLRPRALDLFKERRIKVERRDGKVQPLTITYLQSIYQLHFECGGRECDYKLSIGDDGILGFATSERIRKSIEEVAAEMFKELRTIAD